MNKFIEDQLNKLNSVDVEKLSDTEFLIRKKKDVQISVGNYYIIELADYILHPSSNFTLASNWNKGIVPKSKMMKVSVTQIIGKMIKVDSIGVDDTFSDLDDVYMGLWLPMGGIKVVKEL